MKHALIVGGTGMLSNVSLWLLDNGYHISVIARNPIRMKNLIEKTGSERKITPILVDYTNVSELQAKIKDTIKQNGNIDIVVAWIHSSGDDALPIIVEEVSKDKNEWKLFHVLGSSSNLEKIKKKASAPNNCTYHQVQLGFVIEGVNSRWLTNQEISNGIIEAIKKRKQVFTVGVIEPWEMRP
ncbi:short-chain dehydrogenase [Bacillus sp. S/N-304-OC-R1]|uniref:short-chain dehydrogenase n=1 Tax=Bacillus sp. S/N-304-OC-R1 TaxID=2758034 RepID=UPI001C8EFEEF|nr:short-chain dehydrogenase [Bacillus sp. S/N-304-OC-R1]MBY0121658.1 SDR family NAD(P)-dependent oxidoreductase [Bacillus sp. S/N-304-OC-R1]